MNPSITTPNRSGRYLVSASFADHHPSNGKFFFAWWDNENKKWERDGEYFTYMSVNRFWPEDDLKKILGALIYVQNISGDDLRLLMSDEAKLHSSQK